MNERRVRTERATSLLPYKQGVENVSEDEGFKMAPDPGPTNKEVFRAPR